MGAAAVATDLKTYAGKTARCDTDQSGAEAVVRNLSLEVCRRFVALEVNDPDLITCANP